jgi:DNA mismatch endonuclease (patch repair protein)
MSNQLKTLEAANFFLSKGAQEGFWHLHENCTQYKYPKSRLGFWAPKLEANRARDQEVLRRLAEAGWGALVVWECELREREKLANTIRNFLGEARDGLH